MNVIFKGTRVHLKYQNEVSLASDVAYYGLTTVAGMILSADDEDQVWIFKFRFLLFDRRE